MDFKTAPIIVGTKPSAKEVEIQKSYFYSGAFSGLISVFLKLGKLKSYLSATPNSSWALTKSVVLAPGI